MVGGPRTAPPPTAAQAAAVAAHSAAHAARLAAAAAPGAAPPLPSTGRQESFHEKLQRVKRQLLMDPSLPVRE